VSAGLTPVTRWGFLGAGWVAERAMAPAVHASASGVLAGVASRDPVRAQRLAPERTYASYLDLLDDPTIDVVYICLANHQHLPWVLAALRAGKNVLCEKPLGLTAAEVENMAAEAAAADRLLVEAVWNRWHPRFGRLVHLARDGALGSLVSIECRFTFTSDPTGGYRADPAMGGGALLDVGGYQAHAWVALTGGASDVVVTEVARTDGATGIDMTTSAAALIDGSVAASLLCSFELPEQQRLIVTGTSGPATMTEGAAFTAWREASQLDVLGRTETFPEVDAFEVMVEAVGAKSRGEDAWVVPLEESLRAAQILDLIRLADSRQGA
jgi:xylose dehydrogenase (NAD/NADP)